jgi:hypothetical protein
LKYRTRVARSDELWVEDVRGLGDHALHVRDVRLAVEAVDRLELGEVGLRAELEAEVLDRPVVRLSVELAVFRVEPEREQREQVAPSVLVDLVPRHPACGVRLEVGDQPEDVATLSLVPDQLVEDELVTDVRVAGGHESGERRERLVVRHRLGDRVVLAVTEDDAPTHEVVWSRHVVDDLVEGLDAELSEEVGVVADRRRPPRVERDVLGRPVGAPGPAVRAGDVSVHTPYPGGRGKNRSFGRAPTRAQQVSNPWIRAVESWTPTGGFDACAGAHRGRCAASTRSCVADSTSATTPQRAGTTRPTPRALRLVRPSSVPRRPMLLEARRPTRRSRQ